MGNSIYRISPQKKYNSSSGFFSRLRFASNQITGWRNSQEDRYVCLPNFVGDFGFFAVYDGHGGEDVVQYLERFLHLFLAKELELTNDVELALYLSFINCDSSIRSISDAEKALIENDLVKEFEIPNQEERRKVLFGSRDGAGTSAGNPMHDDLRAMITSACLRELPSVSYLIQAPLQESDESDDDYQPEDKDENFSANEMDTSDNSGELFESYSESSEDDNLNLLDKEEKSEENIASTFKGNTKECSSKAYMTEHMDQNIIVMETNEDTGCSSKADMTESRDQNIIAMETGADTENIEGKKKKQECDEEHKDKGKQFGMHCGSTATVLLINESKIFIAHVGDSRCVACIKGQAVDLTSDHRPTNKEEYERIINAGGSVTEDGRIDGVIDMSRAFGDFHFKSLDDILTVMTAEPHIAVLDVSDELEFIIIASDGIWNTMSSTDVIQYIKMRMGDGLELQDLCGELFEELISEKITPDGSGCDNMTAIIINFSEQKDITNNSYICVGDVYEYKYPPVTPGNNKNCKENSELKLDQKKVNDESHTKSKHKEIPESFGNSKKFNEIEPDEKSNCDTESDAEGNCPDVMIVCETNMKNSQSESRVPLQPILDLNQSTEVQLYPGSVRPIEHHYDRHNIENIVQSLGRGLQATCSLLHRQVGVLQEISGSLSNIKGEIDNALRILNNKLQSSYSTNLTSTTTQFPRQMKTHLAGPSTNEGCLSSEKYEENSTTEEVPDHAPLQSSSIQMEADFDKKGQNSKQYFDSDSHNLQSVAASDKQTRRIEIIDITDEDSQMIHEHSNVEHEHSNVEHEHSNVEHEQSNVEHEQSNVEHEQSNVEHEQSNIEHEQSNIELEQSNIELEQSNIELEQSNIELEQSNIELEQSNIKRPFIEGDITEIPESPEIVYKDCTNEESKKSKQSVEQVDLAIQSSSIQMEKDIHQKSDSHSSVLPIASDKQTEEIEMIDMSNADSQMSSINRHSNLEQSVPKDCTNKNSETHEQGVLKDCTNEKSKKNEPSVETDKVEPENIPISVQLSPTLHPTM